MSEKLIQESCIGSEGKWECQSCVYSEKKATLFFQNQEGNINSALTAVVTKFVSIAPLNVGDKRGNVNFPHLEAVRKGIASFCQDENGKIHIANPLIDSRKSLDE